MLDDVLARLLALNAATTPQLRDEWRKLFDTPPPQYNRKFLVSRLSYRVQELAYGGLKPSTIARLEALGEELDGGKPARRKIPGNRGLVSGTKLQREWQTSNASFISRCNGRHSGPCCGI
jgi:hypothetical protein